MSNRCFLIFLGMIFAHGQAFAMASVCELSLVHTALNYEAVTPDSLRSPVLAPWVTTDQFLAALAQAGVGDNPLIGSALVQAWKSHQNMVRADGGSYMEQHVLPVALSAMREWHFNPEVRHSVRLPVIVAAALLHDVLEDDGSLTVDIIAEKFGAEVAPLVFALTKPSIKFEGFEKLKAKWFKNYIYVARLGRAGPAAIAIKLADRLNNVTSTLALFNDHSTMTSERKETAAFYVLETQEFYEGLAQRVSYHYYLRLRFVLDRIRMKLDSRSRPWVEQEAAMRERILRSRPSDLL